MATCPGQRSPRQPTQPAFPLPSRPPADKPRTTRVVVGVGHSTRLSPRVFRRLPGAGAPLAGLNYGKVAPSLEEINVISPTLTALLLLLRSLQHETHPTMCWNADRDAVVTRGPGRAAGSLLPRRSRAVCVDSAWGPPPRGESAWRTSRGLFFFSAAPRTSWREASAMGPRAVTAFRPALTKGHLRAAPGGGPQTCPLSPSDALA